MKTDECHSSNLGMKFRNWYLPGREECSLPSPDQLELYPFQKNSSYNEALCKTNILEHLRKNEKRIKKLCQAHIYATTAPEFSTKKEFTVYR